MKSLHSVAAWLGIVASAILGVSCSSQPTAPSLFSLPTVTAEQYAASLPKDVYPDSRSRIPLIKREELDEKGKKAYDLRTAADTKSLAGLQGPGSLRLHGSGRSRAGASLEKRLQELARLVVSREMDQVFEWTVHEPVALKAGLDPAIIDVIRYRKSLDGVPETEQAIIQLGREIFQKHKVSSETFAAALKQLGKKNLIDLCDLMGSYATTAILLHTVDLHLPSDRKPLLPVP